MTWRFRIAKLVEGIPHGDSELLNLFHSNIQDGSYEGHLQILQKTSSHTVMRIEPKLDGRHQSDRDSELLK